VPDFERVTIEPASFADPRDGSRPLVVFGHGTYARGSILEGQPKRVFLAQFDSIEEAKATYPDAEELNYSSAFFPLSGESLADMSGLPKEPPSWFDPSYAGESWDEEE